MDLSPFKRDIDELILDFSKGDFTTLAEMKMLWKSRKFTYIFEAAPSSNLAFFMQSLYAQTIGYIVGTTSLSSRVGGLYCLYCLYETQHFKPPYRIYLSWLYWCTEYAVVLLARGALPCFSQSELKRLKDLVVDAKEKAIKVVPILIKRMLERNVFLLGFVDINEACVAEKVSKLTDVQNTRVQIACEKLFAHTQIEKLLHMDMGMEVDLNGLKNLSSQYAEAKKLAIQDGGGVVNIQDIEHISEKKPLIGDVIKSFSEDWNAQKEVFYQQTQLNHRRPPQSHSQQGDRETDHDEELDSEENQQQDDQEFDEELERLLF